MGPGISAPQEAHSALCCGRKRCSEGFTIERCWHSCSPPAGAVGGAGAVPLPLAVGDAGGDGAVEAAARLSLLPPHGLFICEAHSEAGRLALSGESLHGLHDNRDDIRAAAAASVAEAAKGKAMVAMESLKLDVAERAAALIAWIAASGHGVGLRDALLSAGAADVLASVLDPVIAQLHDLADRCHAEKTRVVASERAVALLRSLASASTSLCAQEPAPAAEAMHALLPGMAALASCVDVAVRTHAMGFWALLTRMRDPAFVTVSHCADRLRLRL